MPSVIARLGEEFLGEFRVVGIFLQAVVEGEGIRRQDAVQRRRGAAEDLVDDQLLVDGVLSAWRTRRSSNGFLVMLIAMKKVRVPLTVITVVLGLASTCFMS